jgi:hypothetical protein
MLKEKFYDEKFDEKKIFRHTKSILLILKLISYQKLLVKYFKIWHKFILNENVQEIYQILENVKSEIDVLKLRNMVKILENNISKQLHSLAIRSRRKSKTKTEIKFIHNNILYMENYYNNKLLKTCKALQLLYNLRSKRKRFVFRRNNKEKNSINLFANKVGTYFDMWKLKFTRIRKFMKVKYDIYLKLLSIFVF